MGELFAPERETELDLVSLCIERKFSALCNYIQAFLSSDSQTARRNKYSV